MSLHAPRPENKFDPAPSGSQQAALADIIDLGMVSETYNNEPKLLHRVRLIWQTAEVDPKRGQPFLVFQKMTLSMHKKSTMRGFVESLLGRAFVSDDEAYAFNLIDLIGINALLNIVHNIGTDGNKWASIKSVMPLPKGMPVVKVAGYARKDGTPVPVPANPIINRVPF